MIPLSQHPHLPALDDPSVTPLERETVKRLRNRGGWWEGDGNAVRVLRQYAEAIRKKRPTSSQPRSKS